MFCGKVDSRLDRRLIVGDAISLGVGGYKGIVDDVKDMVIGVVDSSIIARPILVDIIPPPGRPELEMIVAVRSVPEQAVTSVGPV